MRGALSLARTLIILERSFGCEGFVADGFVCAISRSSGLRLMVESLLSDSVAGSSCREVFSAKSEGSEVICAAGVCGSSSVPAVCARASVCVSAVPLLAAAGCCFLPSAELVALAAIGSSLAVEACSTAGPIVCCSRAPVDACSISAFAVGDVFCCWLIKNAMAMRAAVERAAASGHRRCSDRALVGASPFVLDGCSRLLSFSIIRFSNPSGNDGNSALRCCRARRSPLSPWRQLSISLCAECVIVVEVLGLNCRVSYECGAAVWRACLAALP